MPENPAGELLAELEQQEADIRRCLESEEPSLLGTGVPMIDYAVDQVRFFRAAWRKLKSEGLSDLQVLERAALLSLPQCLRQADSKWKRELILEHALSGQWLCWQRALDARHPGDRPGVLPRHPGAPQPMLQLSPYPSGQTLRKGPLVHLEADVSLALGLAPSPVHPIRSLAPGLAWSLHLRFFHQHRWCPLDVIVDPPWDFNLQVVQEALRGMAQRLESLSEGASRVPDPPPSAVLGHWKATADELRAAAEELSTATGAERAVILQRCFALPGTLYLSPVAFVTEDMPPALMAELIGWNLKRVGLLSVREVRRFERYAELRRLSTRPDLSPSEARRLGKRLADFQRPLRHSSVTRYEAKVLRGLRDSRPYPPRLGERLHRLAGKYGLHLRTVYRRFGAFLHARGLGRDERGFRSFARLLRRQHPSGAIK